ncbi:GLUG motif-containing protein, partial [Amaricoccus sp.]|uniref:GLUG motif-containing protein n=1 Tax=Amaricoccus sp. TaxID=1872485 RepID=UPI001B635625
MALAGPGRAETLPSGGRVAQGKASIAKTGPGRMQIRQKSKSAVVNWQGFSIGRADRVDIDQPSRRSAILNRVTGKTKSSIRGQLTANGKVYLVNPNGIEITQTGKVKANAFVGSTLDISDRDFARGKGRFAAAGELAAVRNAGVVEARSYAALLGGEVENSGVISAELGTVGLGSGRRATLKFPNGMLAVALPASGDGEGALIDSSGALRGERVEIRAAAAREAARQAVNLSGVIEARSVTKRGGAIVISGGGGEVAVSGRLDASARRGKGGAIEATGDRIRLAGARLDASGPEGGGQINIGGGLRGEGPLPRARLTSADAATVISADATRAGHGGAVVVWSDVHTAFAGRITARGGREGGDGGFAEVSGKRLLSFTGTADLSAARGAFGTLLLDPFNVTISDEISVGMDQAGGVWSPNVNDSNLNATQVETLLATANVTVTTANDAGTQAGDIDVLAPLEWTTPTILSLQADGDISLLSSITAAQGVLDLSAGGDIATSDSAVIELAQARWSAVGDMTIAALLTVQDGGFGAGADMSIAGAGVALGTSGLSAVGSMGISAPVTATSLTINAGELAWTAADDLAFNGQITAATGRIDSGGSLSISGVGADLGTFTLAAASDVQIAAPIAGDDLTIIAGGDGNINTTAAGSIEGGTLTLSAGNVISAEGAVDVDLFLLQAGAWTQNTTSLPAFEAGDFRIVNGLVASFLRVLGGNGGDQPYLVADVYGLQGISGFVNQNFALSNNIDASGTAGWNDLGDGPLGFLPIQGPSLSAAPLPFTGDFDGAGATIDGLTITRDSEDQVGLFARLGAGAQVTDLTLTNVSVTGGYEVGGIAGRIDAGATVSGSTIAGAVTLDGAYYSSYYASAVGGVAGVSAGSILDSTSAATVTGAMGSSDGVTVASAGGLVGESSGSIAGSSASGPVSLTGGYGVSLYAGGLAGSSSNSITDSSASGAVTATGDNAFAGGLVGGSTGSIAGSSATGTATASGYFAYAGGLVGGSTGSIADSSATGAATASGYYAFAGGLVGDSQGAITGSSASGAVSATGSGYDYAGATAGGLAGRSAGSILDSTSSSSVTASVDTEFPGGSATAGGLVGDNQGTITDAAASGTVSAGSTEGGLVLVGGLAGRSIDAISGSTASGGVTGEISGGTLMAGGLVGETLDVGETAGTIDDSSATGDVTGSSDAGGSVWVGGLVGGSSAAITASFATGPVSGTMAETGDAEAVLAVGGLAGVNVDAITDAFATGAVTATADGDGVGPAVSISAGGLVGGTDDSAIERAFASGAVLVQGDDFDAAAGGLVGQASGSIEDAFATGDVASVGGSVGGLVGLNQGSIDRTYAIGAVSDGGDGAGGLVGLNDGGTVDGSFWDTVTSGTGFSDGGTGLLTAEFQDTAGFFAQADAAGWDFDNVWAPSSAGFYPEIYTINPVVRVDPDDATREYGLANPTFTFGDPIGGPGTFLFGPDGDDDPLDYAGTLSSPADENSDIGAYDILASGNITSPLGQVYRATTLVPGTLTVTPATLTVDVGSDSKVYGDTYDFGDLDYTVNG